MSLKLHMWRWMTLCCQNVVSKSRRCDAAILHCDLGSRM